MLRHWAARFRRWKLDRMTRNICRREAEADAARQLGVPWCDEHEIEYYAYGMSARESICSLRCAEGLPCKFATLERSIYERKLRERGLA